MSATDDLDRRPTPRICMATSRRFRRKAFQAGIYENQDVLCEIDDVDLIELEPRRRFATIERWHNRLVFRDPTERLALVNTGVKPVRLRRDYELFMAVCQTYEDLRDVSAVVDWKDRCRTSACWVDEIWVASLHKYRHWRRLFDQFDHVFVGYHGTAGPLSEFLGRRCHRLSPGINTLRFTPVPEWPARAIDVYSVGRRWEGVHDALRALSRQRGLFYLHDTFRAAEAEVYDHSQHRDVFATIVKRAKCFLVAPAKTNAYAQTKGQVGEIGYRYFEGAAGGAVMLGGAPDSDVFRELFDWPDAVVPLNVDGSDTTAVVTALLNDRERLSALGARNAAESLLRHDWVYRWEELLTRVGLTPSARLRKREDTLRRLAGTVASTAAATASM